MNTRKTTLLIFMFLFAAAGVHAGRLETANVMSPLTVRDWDEFKAELALARQMGVDAVSTDVWWGMVEKEGDEKFDWSYYDTVSDLIIAAGLKWTPILAFHRCGGNVGDDCNIPLPPWIWTHFGGDGTELKYLSEQGNHCSEVVSLWADEIVMDEYREFMQAFEKHYGPHHAHILEVNISCGPAGELRYPSYNGHDHGTGYPNRGALQCYDARAQQDFRREMLDKYGSLAGINRAWGTRLNSLDDVRPPRDAPGFVDRLDYVNTPYGRDLIAWYNRSLAEHGQRMIDVAKATFDEGLSTVDLGVKIPGVHWKMADPHTPRIAEIMAGLIPTDIDFQNDATAHGYAPLIKAVAACNTVERPVLLHFTCLEMDNENTPPAYSQAKNLVFWVAEGACADGLCIKGENALSGGVENDYGWGRINNAFQWADYRGLTVLRIVNVTRNDTGREQYTRFIKRFKNYTPPAPANPAAKRSLP